MAKERSRSGSRKIRYAVVGLGHIAQAAVLPAFAHAGNSELTALVSGDPTKLKKLGKKYGVSALYSYDDYDALLKSGTIDAVYIALPNSMHRSYTIRAARAGVHVLCEKPMAVDEKECEAMIRACEHGGVKLMTAYRLHFDDANLKAAEIAASGKLGDPRIFNSIFTMQVQPGNIRVKKEMGGGTLYDIGIYCINAARYIFRAEPVEVTAFTANSGDERFREVEEMVGAVIRFPEDRIATFVTSFGAADQGVYTVVGTKGSLTVEKAYEYIGEAKHRLTIGTREKETTFPSSDQFAPELLHFSQCILEDRDPEPSGREGALDVEIIRALYKSAETGRPVRLDLPQRKTRPTTELETRRPPVKKQQIVKSKKPSKGT